MRFLLILTLMISTAFAPAAAASSCVSMGAAGPMTIAPSVSSHEAMNAAAHKDCDAGVGGAERPGSGCHASCMLACPGDYAAPDNAFNKAVLIKSAAYLDPIDHVVLAPLAHLDPPPPRS